MRLHDAQVSATGCAGPQSSVLKPRQLHKTPAPEAALMSAQRAELLLQYTAEMSALEERVRAEQPLAPLPAADAVKRTFNKFEVYSPNLSNHC